MELSIDIARAEKLPLAVTVTNHQLRDEESSSAMQQFFDRTFSRELNYALGRCDV